MSEAKLKAIRGVLNSFPQTASDVETFVKIMLVVLDDVSDDAVRATAIRYAKGLVPKQSKTFAPTPAEFSSECREYDKLEQLKNRPRIEPPKAAAHLNIVQKQQALRNKWSHLKILAEDINHDRYLKLRKTLPNPHFWSAALGTIYQGQP